MRSMTDEGCRRRPLLISRPSKVHHGDHGEGHRGHGGVAALRRRRPPCRSPKGKRCALRCRPPLCPL